MNKLTLLALASAALGLSACQSPATTVDSFYNYAAEDTAYNAESTLMVRVLVDGLNNPSSLAFSPNGRLAICEAGEGTGPGRVHLMTTEGREIIEDFPSEFWKVDPATGKSSYKVGPLSAVWRDDNNLLITNGGLKDGQETILQINDKGEGTASNPAEFRSADDAGEGNLSGMALNSTGSVAYVCGQGSDAHTWILRYDVAKNELVRAFSADKHGITVNSPMQCRLVNDGELLVLYSGAGGEADGTIVLWDTRTGLPKSQWSLPGLVDPMGMDFVPGSKRTLYVVDNNWSLDRVNAGTLALVTLGSGDEASVTVVDGVNLNGPVACAMGKDNRLYIAELGESFDNSKGRVIVIENLPQ